MSFLFFTIDTIKIIFSTFKIFKQVEALDEKRRSLINFVASANEIILEILRVCWNMMAEIWWITCYSEKRA